MSATLVWPAVTLLGFVLFTGVVVALPTSSTARYEFERNGAGATHRTAADCRRTHPAGGRAASRPAGGPDAPPRPQAAGLPVHPVPASATGAPALRLGGESTPL